MARLLYIAALAAAVSACSLYQPEVTLSGGVRIANRDSGPVGCLAIEQRFRRHASVEWEHCSDAHRGRPFNTREDLSHDTVTIQRSWGGNPR